MNSSSQAYLLASIALHQSTVSLVSIGKLWKWTESNYTIITIDFASHYIVTHENSTNTQFVDRYTTGGNPNILTHSHLKYSVQHDQHVAAEITQTYITAFLGNISKFETINRIESVWLLYIKPLSGIHTLLIWHPELAHTTMIWQKQTGSKCPANSTIVSHKFHLPSRTNIKNMMSHGKNNIYATLS